MLQTTFLLTKVLPLVKISAKRGHILGSKTPKTSQKWPFHICLIDTQKNIYIYFDNYKCYTDKTYNGCVSSWGV